MKNLLIIHQEYLCSIFVLRVSDLQVAKIAKVAGPAATLVGIGISGHKILSGKGTKMDYVDVDVNGVELELVFAWQQILLDGQLVQVCLYTTV